MIRIAALLPVLAATSAIAQTTTPEASMDTAGPFTIILFVVAFFGACAWFAWMTWRNEKKDRAANAATTTATIK